MTRDEWETIALLIDNCCRGGFDETRSAAYFTMFQKFDHGAVMTALNVLFEDGEEWVPPAGKIMKAIRLVEAPPLPAWSEVWAALQAAMKKPEPQALELMNKRCGPVAAAFAQAEGIQRLKFVEFFDPEYGALRIKELQNRWLEFSERTDERMRRGLAIAAGPRSGKGLTKLNLTELGMASDA
jgi:hypothetical protein